jgi:hypothetical protein
VAFVAVITISIILLGAIGLIVVNALHQAASLIVCALREIFDENSYAHFLTRTGLANSQSAYAEFLRQDARHNERRARCC